MPTTGYQGPYFLNERNDFVNFSTVPLVQEAITAASIGVVTQGHTNRWNIDGKYFEQFNTVATSVVAPSFAGVVNGGLNIGALIAANSKEIEITQGNSTAIKNNFVIATSPAFYVRATFNVATLNTVTECSVGFRKQATYATSPLSTYTDYAIIGLSGTAGEIYTQTGIASTYVKTDTTNAATAATNVTFQVNIDASGNVTYQYAVGGAALTAPSTVVAAAMGSALNFIPWIHVTSASGASGEVDLVSYSCGKL